MSDHHVIYTEAALDWMGAALYAVGLANQMERAPRWEELPQRLRDKWVGDARSWLEALVPLLLTSNSPSVLPRSATEEETPTLVEIKDAMFQDEEEHTVICHRLRKLMARRPAPEGPTQP